jgi:hypothetical protein
MKSHELKKPAAVCACGYMFASCMCPCPCGLDDCIKRRRLENCPIKLAKASATKNVSDNKST